MENNDSLILIHKSEFGKQAGRTADSKHPVFARILDNSLMFEYDKFYYCLDI